MLSNFNKYLKNHFKNKHKNSCKDENETTKSSSSKSKTLYSYITVLDYDNIGEQNNTTTIECTVIDNNLSSIDEILQKNS